MLPEMRPSWVILIKDSLRIVFPGINRICKRTVIKTRMNSIRQLAR
jgi:hypothetical protein